MRRIRSRSQGLPALLGLDQDSWAEIQPQLRRLRALRKAYAKPIIAAGIFPISRDLWSGIVNVLAKEEAQHDKKALDRFFERLRAAGVDLDIPHTMPGHPDLVDIASDVVISYASHWGDAGFMLGLAVGMQLGPHAFEGGAL